MARLGAGGALRDKRVLVVESEPMAATDFVARLRSGGIDVVGSVTSVQEALALIATAGALDAALIDVNLDDGRADPIAAALRERGVPLVLVGGGNR